MKEVGQERQRNTSKLFKEKNSIPLSEPQEEPIYLLMIYSFVRHWQYDYPPLYFSPLFYKHLQPIKRFIHCHTCLSKESQTFIFIIGGESFFFFFPFSQTIEQRILRCWSLQTSKEEYQVRAFRAICILREAMTGTEPIRKAKEMMLYQSAIETGLLSVA